MIGTASLLLALGLGGAAVPVADFDIPYFLANPKVHEETLRRCHNDARLAATPECENAELAGTRRIGRPLSPRTKQKKPATPPPVPSPKGPERGT
jgi:hypothetical protein